MILSQDELGALTALDLARQAMGQVVPDILERDGNRLVSYASARAIEAAARPILRAHEIEVDLLGAKLVGGVALACSWVWRCKAWRSEPVVIEIIIDRSGPPAAACSAAISSSGKVFVRLLLRIQEADSDEAELARAHDDARDGMAPRVERLLRSYCKSARTDEATVLRTILGFDPQGCVPTFQMLMAPQVAMLAARLMCQPGMPSKEWEPGSRVAVAGTLPEWMDDQKGDPT